MIIFGWGHRKTKSFGHTGQKTCKHCNNIVNWELKKVTLWFTLFFIPVFPYETHRLLVCPICGAGAELSKEEFEGLINPSGSTRSENAEPNKYAGKTATQISFLKGMEEAKKSKKISQEEL